jgi:phosphopantothenoylcysteine synthetase/decarboxylase
MWINNKTVEWLDSMDLQDKNAKITLAKKRAPDYLVKWQERRKELKQKRINRMKEKELEKLKKDAQHLQNKQNAIDNLLCSRIHLEL